MTALSADRNTPRIEGGVKVLSVAASTKIYAGAIVLRNASGYAEKGATKINCFGVGMALEQVDNSAGNDGDKTVKVRTGIFKFANSASADQITAADIGAFCYVVDDQTVAKTSGSDTRSVAGMVAGVDTDGGVYVEFNESDISAWRKGRRVALPIRVATLVGTNAYQGLSIYAGRIVKLWSIIEGVLTTGNATITFAINGVPITNGVITVVQSGSVAGQINSAVPTALNVVAVGDAVSATVGGTNATATVANTFAEIERD